MNVEQAKAKVIFSGGKTKQNLPAFWEKRDESPFFTYVELICDSSFNKKQVIYLNNQSSIPEKLHAIFVAAVGDLILKVSRNNRDVIKYQLHVITDIYPTGDKFTLEADEVENVEDPTVIFDAYTTDKTEKAAKEFFEAARAKLDISNKVSMYCQTK